MTTKGIVDRTWDVGEDKAKIDGLRNKLDQTIGEFLVSPSDPYQVPFLTSLAIIGFSQRPFTCRRE
jgi:hypothetical protein